MTYRILVTGARSWDNAHLIHHHLSAEVDAARLEGLDVVLVDGMADGADWLCFKWAKKYRVPVEEHPADWSTGRTAGILRNNKMVSLGADVCYAFMMPCYASRCHKERPHWTHGTEHCAKAAERAGIPVVRVYE